jgi:hypothetical protein
VDHLCLCVRVPKSGSSSLSRLLASAFAGRRIFLLPNTLDLDGRVSCFQRLRFWRTRWRNLNKLYGTFDADKVFELINTQSEAGDLIDGGHVDFGSVQRKIKRPLKLITILRNPYTRARSEYNYARQTFRKKGLFGKVDAGLLPKVAARNSFLGYLDFLHDHRAIYGDVASSYLGWTREEPLNSFDDRAVFHCGVLEKADQFTDGLAIKLGIRVEFPHIHRTVEVDVKTIGARERALIEAIYPRDFELYEHFYWSR